MKPFQWLRRHENLQWLGAALLLAGMLVWTNWDLLTGSAFEHWDAYKFFSPYYTLVADHAREGQLLLWNPWTHGGSPDFAEPQVGAFSPLLIAFGAIAGGSSDAFRWYWLFLWFSGGCGMLLLARHLRVPALGGLCVALGYVFSGFYTGHGEHTSVLYSYSFLPFVIWRLDVALQRDSLLAASQAGALWGLSALAGNPVITISSIAILVAWAVGRSWTGGEGVARHRWRSTLAILMTLGVIGVVVLSPTYFSFVWEGHGYTDRSQALPRAFALDSNALHPGALTTLLSPALLPLRFHDPELWSYTDVSSLSIYFGSIPIVLALVSLFSKEQRRWRWFLCGIAVLVLACAMSHALPIRGWFYDLLPPTRYFRHSSMFRGYAVFLFSVLALLGFRDLANMASSKVLRRRFVLVSAVLTVGAGATFVVVAGLANAVSPYTPLTIAHFATAWCGLLAIALAVYFAPKRMAGIVPIALVCLAMIDGALTHQLSRQVLYGGGPSPDSVGEYVPSTTLGPARIHRELDFGGQPNCRSITCRRSNLNLVSKIPTLMGYAPLKNQFHESTVIDPALSSIGLGSDRFWFAREVPIIGLNGRLFDQYSRRIRTLGAPIFVRHYRSSMMQNSPLEPTDDNPLEETPPAARIAVHILSYTPEVLEFELTAPKDGWILVTERWSRSWRASVNGAETPIQGANFIYRAVRIRQGENVIRFWFRPPAVIFVLLASSWLTLMLIGLLSILAYRRSRRSGL